MSTLIKIPRNFLVFLHYQDSDATVKANSFAWEWVATSWKPPIETLMEENEQVVLEKRSN